MGREQGQRNWNRTPRKQPEGMLASETDRATFLDSVMDIPVEHKKNTFIAVQLHEYRMPDDTHRKMLDIRFWHTLKNGMKKKGKGVRFTLEHAEQLALRLLRLSKRYCKPIAEGEDNGMVEDRFKQASRIGWED